MPEPETIALVIAGILFLAILTVFPGLNLWAWAKKQYDEMGRGPITWK